MLGSWLIHVLTFTSTPWPTSAAIGIILGYFVAAMLAVLYFSAVIIAVRPRTWRAEDELYERSIGNTGNWPIHLYTVRDILLKIICEEEQRFARHVACNPMFSASDYTFFLLVAGHIMSDIEDEWLGLPQCAKPFVQTAFFLD